MTLSPLTRAALSFGLWLAMLLALWLAPVDLKALAVAPAICLAMLMARPIYTVLFELVSFETGLFGFLVFLVILFLTTLVVAPLFSLWQLYRHFATR